MNRCGLIFVTILLYTMPTYGQRPTRLQDIPTWAQHARWYYINVPLFSNGDTKNDPKQGSPLQMDWPDIGLDQAYDYPSNKHTPHDQGGDLAGVIDRLPYLKRLGINAILLSPLFTRGDDGSSDLLPLRHVDPSVGPTEKSPDGSDQLLISLLAKAHSLDMRIALEIDCLDIASLAGDTESQVDELHQLISPWLDPNKDGHPKDGIDGLAFRNIHTLAKPVWFHWIVKMKNDNANLLTMGPGQEFIFDTQINYHMATAITHFFRPDNVSYSAKQFIDDMATAKKRYGSRTGDNTLVPLSASRLGRARRMVSDNISENKKTIVDDFRRLSMIFQYFYSGVPFTYFGDEVGMAATAGRRFTASMWWNKSHSGTQHHSRIQGGFYALQKLLNGLREKYEPMVRGEFSLEKDDDKNKILIVSRTLSSDRLVLIINYSTTKQLVKITTHHPNQKLTILSPQIKSSQANPFLKRQKSGTNSSSIPKFRIGGEQQIAKADGQVSFWVKPMSVRLVIDMDAPQ